MKKYDSLANIQFERRIKPLRKNFDAFQIRNGWINYVRTVLGLKLSTLAKLANTTSSTIQQAEKREVQNKITIETLRKLANAMDCEFVYAFVPKKNINDVIMDRALIKAKKILDRADTHMSLENQKVQQDFNKRIERLANKLIESGDAW